MPFLFSKNLTSVSLQELGGKGAALARLREAGFAIPEWFAVRPDDQWTQEQLTAAVVSLDGELFAVRSSGASEDGAGLSFAGQFESFLEVYPSDIPEKIESVRQSATSESILSYCKERGITDLPGTPTVLVQRMISPRVAGVAFSADPVSGKRKIAIVSAAEGTGEKLVSGEVDGENWSVDRKTNILLAPDKALLSEKEAVAVAELARDCEAASGCPQDIEWAIDRAGKLWLLQSRPITNLSQLPDPEDELFVWDNSNIAESYCGVTTPLTFSFARRIYEAVYREFCVLMAVPSKRIERAEPVFPKMLGLIEGRVYYNLVSWYRVLALLPGFQVNRGFMEQMMGVREPLPDEIVEKIVSENSEGKRKDTLALVGTLVGLVRQLIFLPRQISRFQKRLDSALAAPPVPLARLSGQELVDHYQDLETQLLRKWDAPLVNDFFAMIFYGLLRSLCGKWLGDADGSLQNELLLDCGEIVSAEPPRRIIAMSKLAKEVPGLAELLVDHEIPVSRKRNEVAKNENLNLALESYLEDFGDRCLEELKLESPTVGDDPASLLSSIGAMALRKVPISDLETTEVPVPEVKGWLRKLVFRFVLKQAKARVATRENLRFERTRLFGRVRKIVSELGKRMVADGVLGEPRDVFYLELGEILSYWDATGTTTGLGVLAKQRLSEFESYKQGEDPPDRFETRGSHARYEIYSSSVEETIFDATLKGNGACPGRVTGRVRVVFDPRGARLEPGEILVAQQTDPGWVVLFPAAAGLLVERGSLLSHSAIVSRELRLPCIVSLPGITKTLKTGDLVEMDGASGAVKILES